MMNRATIVMSPRRVCLALSLVGLTGAAACSSTIDAINKRIAGSDDKGGVQSTNASELAARAAEIKSPAMAGYLETCAGTAACQDLAAEVKELQDTALRQMQADKDASQTLDKFETKLRALADCMDNNDSDETPAPKPPTAPVADPNSMTCQGTDRPDGSRSVTCTSGNSKCTAEQSPDGTVVETCTVRLDGTPADPNVPSNPNAPVDPNGPANPNTPADPNGTVDPSGPANPNAPTDPNGTPADPNTISGGATGGTTGGAGGSADGSGQGVEEKCTTTFLPDGSSSVTCTCNVNEGTCSVAVQPDASAGE
jgi:hypothetical protein